MRTGNQHVTVGGGRGGTAVLGPEFALCSGVAISHRTFRVSPETNLGCVLLLSVFNETEQNGAKWKVKQCTTGSNVS